MVNKSSRPWKSGSKKVSTLNATPASKVSFNERRERQKKMQALKAVADEMRSEEIRKREQERKRQEAQKKAREENLVKSAKVQVVTNAKKVCRFVCALRAELACFRKFHGVRCQLLILSTNNSLLTQKETLKTPRISS
ncbi:Coiledcoil domain containing protein [Diplonema papillatum]|nr:Coiledcoil domain containing protein [Diplonema papillatum]